MHNRFRAIRALVSIYRFNLASAVRSYGQWRKGRSALFDERGIISNIA